MQRAMESVIVLLLSSTVVTTVGCSGNMGPQVPAQQLFSAQRQARQLVASQTALTQQYSSVVAERDNSIQLAQALEQEKNMIAQHVGTMENDLAIANQRLSNLMAERNHLQQRYAAAIDEESGVISDSLSGRFQDLADRYPDIDFDPNTGMSRFNGEILFDSGSAALKPGAKNMLREFAAVLNDNEARELKILVCGHTDDQRIAKNATYAQHKTNWHLSTNRANAVVLALKKLGIGEGRLGAMGYSKFQPVTDNYDNGARQMNRRVEIFVLAPDALIAQWDPRTSRN